MNKYVLAAIAGSASACHHHHHSKYAIDWGNKHERPDTNTLLNNPPIAWMYDNVEIIEEVPPPRTCDVEPERMKDSQFFIEIIKHVHNSAVKGAYNTPEEHPISENCYGVWMNKEFATIHDIH